MGGRIQHKRSDKINMKNKKLTLSIGIPVHNEADNIGYLLESINKQKQTCYVLEKINVICDGTTDGTDRIVFEKAKHNKLIKLQNDGIRKGKKKRLTQIYKLNKSDVTVTFDGDVVLSHSNVLNKMMENFYKDEIGIVSARLVPVSENTFFGKLQVVWFKVWLEARRDYKNGDNINNVRGCALAVRSDLAKTIKFDQKIVSDAQFIYFFALKNKMKFKWAQDAKVLFRVPSTLSDFLAQKTRSSNGKQQLAERFGSKILSEYKIPNSYKLRAVGKMITKYPFLTIAAGLFQIGFRVSSSHLKKTYDNGLWKQASSTKKAIRSISI